MDTSTPSVCSKRRRHTKFPTRSPISPVTRAISQGRWPQRLLRSFYFDCSTKHAETQSFIVRVKRALSKACIEFRNWIRNSLGNVVYFDITSQDGLQSSRVLTAHAALDKSCPDLFLQKIRHQDIPMEPMEASSWSCPYFLCDGWIRRYQSICGVAVSLQWCGPSNYTAPMRNWSDAPNLPTES